MAQESFEEYRVVKGPVMGWVLLFIFSALVWGWGMFIHMMVPESPREWDFGAIPDTPGISIYSTKAPVLEKHPPLQFEPLPERVPWEKSIPSAVYW
jgi:hypothetical protein